MASTSEEHSEPKAGVTRFREAALSSLIGVGVVFLIFFARAELFGWRLAIYGALCGFSIYISNRTLFALVGEPIRRLGIPRPLVAAVVFFFGGGVGWGLVSLAAQATGLTRIDFSARDIGVALGIAGCMGLLFGLVFFFFGVLQDRLRQSVARLKEAEFAEKELELARSIQRRLLPPDAIEGDGFRVSARNLPARVVAGDFYDVFHLADGTVGLVVADVSGKGIGAALIMASVKAVVPLVAAGRSAAETLEHLNRKLAEELAPREFVALCFARYDPGSGALAIANAGLPDPYRISGSASVEALSVPGPRLPLGARRGVAYEELRITVAPGQRVLFLTDGMPEARDAAGDPLGYEALSRMIASSAGASGDFLDRLLASVRAATGDATEDDWTALLLDRRG
jgi:Stage II sporulation protein E (SpoIIE)